MKKITNWWTKNEKLTGEWSDLNKKHFAEITKGHDKKVWWKCSLNPSHIWEATVWSRVGCLSGCPYCSGRIATTENNLEKLKPEISKEWNSKNKMPSEITVQSNFKADWKCVFGHEWKTQVSNRTKQNGTNCPYCSGKKPTEENNLLKMFPDLCEEWGLKNEISPKSFLSKSHKKVWWKCVKGHEYLTSISSRTQCQSGCPFCSWQTSKLEIRLYCEIKKMFTDVKWRDRSLGFEIDILLPNEKIAVEVDGWYWHKDEEDKDTEKNNKIIKCGFTPLRVRGKPLNKINEYDVIFKKSNTDMMIVPNVIRKIYDLTNLKMEYIPWLNESEFAQLLLNKDIKQTLL